MLGFPTTHHSVRGAGAANDFQRGRISWHATTGAWETLGEVAVRYRALGSELGQLGFPNGASAIPQGRRGAGQPVPAGRISWHPEIGAKVLGSELVPRFLLLGGESGTLGYPIVDQDSPAAGVVRAVFQHGRISWSEPTGAIETRDIIADAYARSGAETGPLGLPIELEQKLLLGRAQRFQTGRISAQGDKAFFTRGPIAKKYEEMGAESSSLGYPTSDEYVLEPGRVRNDFQLGYITYDEGSDEAVASITG